MSPFSQMSPLPHFLHRIHHLPRKEAISSVLIEMNTSASLAALPKHMSLRITASDTRHSSPDFAFPNGHRNFSSLAAATRISWSGTGQLANSYTQCPSSRNLLKARKWLFAESGQPLLVQKLSGLFSSLWKGTFPDYQASSSSKLTISTEAQSSKHSLLKPMAQSSRRSP